MQVASALRLGTRIKQLPVYELWNFKKYSLHNELARKSLSLKRYPIVLPAFDSPKLFHLLMNFWYRVWGHYIHTNSTNQYNITHDRLAQLELLVTGKISSLPGPSNLPSTHSKPDKPSLQDSGNRYWYSWTYLDPLAPPRRRICQGHGRPNHPILRSPQLTLGCPSLQTSINPASRLSRYRLEDRRRKPANPCTCAQESK
jgi:hypothetical protein